MTSFSFYVPTKPALPGGEDRKLFDILQQISSTRPEALLSFKPKLEAINLQVTAYPRNMARSFVINLLINLSAHKKDLLRAQTLQVPSSNWLQHIGSGQHSHQKLLYHGLGQRSVALDFAQWASTKLGKDLIDRSVKQDDLTIAIDQYLCANKKLEFPRYQPSKYIRLGLKLLICEKLYGAEISPVLIFGRNMRSVAFHELEQLVALMKSSESIVELIQQNKQGFNRYMEACKRE